MNKQEQNRTRQNALANNTLYDFAKKNNLFGFIDSLNKFGGASYNMVTGVLNPENGYMVSLAEYEHKIPHGKEYDTKAITQELRLYIGKHGIELEQPNRWLGAWFDGTALYFDISEIVMDQQTAIELGKERKQIAIFDNEKKESIYL